MTNYPIKKRSYSSIFKESLPSTNLDTSIELAESPVTFKRVAGASIIVAIIVSIGKADTGNPISFNISISDIVPPPIGAAVK